MADRSARIAHLWLLFRARIWPAAQPSARRSLRLNGPFLASTNAMKQRPAGTPSIRSDASRHRASVISVIRATRIGRYRDCGPWASRRCPRTVFLQLAPEAMCPGLFRARKLRAFLYGRGLRRSCPVFSLSSACHNQLAGEQTGPILCSLQKTKLLRCTPEHPAVGTGRKPDRSRSPRFAHSEQRETTKASLLGKR